MTLVFLLGLLLSVTNLVCSRPQSFLIQPNTTVSVSSTKMRDPSDEIQAPEISSFHVTSRIQFRYARTVIESQIVNPDTAAQLTYFAVVIPDSALISNFSMVVGNEEFVARVEEKERAEKTFQKAVIKGREAGLVTQDVRDSNRFTVSANVEPGHKIVFRLTYDELLNRKAGMYKQNINIDLGQVVEDFRVEVLINESLPITTIKVPQLLDSNEIDPSEEENKIVEVDWKAGRDDRNARIVFAPSREEQKAAKEQKVSGQFVISYDVDRQGQDSEIQVIDGYFVHYFVPENLETLPKHFIFILDISSSMYGETFQVLKDTMFGLLDDLQPSDFFNIITFSNEVKHWVRSMTTDSIPEIGADAVSASKENKEAAIEYVLDLEATGGTNTTSAILAGLQLALDVVRKETLPQGVASIIVYLSDGRATKGETNSDSFKTKIAQANSHSNLPIFSVVLGLDAGYQFQDISQTTDSPLELYNFYSEISGPLVTNLRFDYVGELVDKSSVSNTEVRTFFKGGQYVVVGKLQEVGDGRLEVRVTGDTAQGYRDVIKICLRDSTESDDSQLAGSHITPPHQLCLPHSPPAPQRTQAQEFIQSLHAFLNIQQLLQKDQKKEALALSLENNFVTPLTSLVVVKPGEEDSLPVFLSSYDYSDYYDYYYDNLTSLIGSGLYDDYLYYDDGQNWIDIDTPITTTTPTIALPSCTDSWLTLYSYTYHMGEHITLLDDSSHLSSMDDRAVSATVSGSCCWQLYADPDFRGESYRLSPEGDYTTTNSFGRNLFREVSSVRRIPCS